MEQKQIDACNQSMEQKQQHASSIVIHITTPAAMADSYFPPIPVAE
jgi:hypothetical protein